MPDETAQQRAERQNRLSHAMGVMFLQDKVDKLERDVSKITYPRSMRPTKSGPAAGLAASAHTRYDASTHGLPRPRAATGPGVAATTTTTTTAAPATATSTASATCIRLVDASVLIFSLRSVHNWSRDGTTCVVIPLEAINTLDLLKKGDAPINLAARKATRWLEDRIALAPNDGDRLLTHPTPGMFAQKQGFRASAAHIEQARAAVVAARAPTSQPEASTSVRDAFACAEAPRYLRELLAACVYCRTACAHAVDFAVALAYPPAHVQDQMLDESTAEPERPSYLIRTDGRATEAWLDAYGVSVDVVPTSKTWTGEKTSSRFHAHSGAPHDTDARPTSTSAAATRSARHSSGLRSESDTATPTGTLEADDDGSIVARPSSPTSSYASFTTSHTASTQEDRASHRSNRSNRSNRSAHSSASSSARIVRHPPDAPAVCTSDAADARSGCRLTARTLHKTKSGADKMEDYLRRLEAGVAAESPTPTTSRRFGS